MNMFYHHHRWSFGVVGSGDLDWSQVDHERNTVEKLYYTPLKFSESWESITYGVVVESKRKESA